MGRRTSRSKFPEIRLLQDQNRIWLETKIHSKEAVEKTVEWSKEYLNGADMLEVTDRQIREFFA